MSYEEEDTCLPGDCETFPASLHQTNPLHVALGPDVYGYVRRRIHVISLHVALI